MKRIKRTFLVLFLLLLVAVAFRAPLYRLLVSYEAVGQRPVIAAHETALVSFIEGNWSGGDTPDIHDIVSGALLITRRKLNFTADRNATDPNRLIFSESAHCVGYAHFFATTCNYLLARHGLADTWQVQPRIGKLYFLGVDVHQFFDSAFFRDHDFVTVDNRVTGESFAVDPTLNDYAWIERIALRGE